jgi:hypothetical protein
MGIDNMKSERYAVTGTVIGKVIVNFARQLEEA